MLRCCLYGAQYSRETEGYDRELVYLKRAEAYADTLEYNWKIGDLFLDIWQSDTKKARKQEALAGASGVIRRYVRIRMPDMWTG